MDNNILGKRIKELRENKDLNQLEFSRILNISNTTLSQYEAGNRTPSDEIKQKIADYFGVSIDYLLGRTEVRNLQENNIGPKAYNTIDVSGLPEEAIKQIKDYVEFMKQKYRQDESLKRK